MNIILFTTRFGMYIFLDIIMAYYVSHCIIVITLLWAWEYYMEYIAMYREYVLQEDTFFDIILHLFVENKKCFN